MKKTVMNYSAASSGVAIHLQHKANYAASGGEFTPQRLIKARELLNKY